MSANKHWLVRAKTIIGENGLLSTFIARALLLYLTWFLLYNTNDVIAPWLNKNLTLFIAEMSVRILNLFSDGYHLGSYKINNIALEYGLSGGQIRLYMNDNPKVGIADSCNGLELYVLYIGYIIAYPKYWRPKAQFIAAGLPLLVFLNVMRVIGLALVFMYMPKFFDFIHHYLFTVIMYAGILFLWHRFSIVQYEK